MDRVRPCSPTNVGHFLEGYGSRRPSTPLFRVHEAAVYSNIEDTLIGFIGELERFKSLQDSQVAEEQMKEAYRILELVRGFLMEGLFRLYEQRDRGLPVDLRIQEIHESFSDMDCYLASYYMREIQQFYLCVVPRVNQIKENSELSAEERQQRLCAFEEQLDFVAAYLTRLDLIGWFSELPDEEQQKIKVVKEGAALINEAVYGKESETSFLSAEDDDGAFEVAARFDRV